jgi:hypothetical protein
MGAERSLPFFAFSHMDQVVGVTNIKSSIIAGLGKTVQGFADQR